MRAAEAADQEDNKGERQTDRQRIARRQDADEKEEGAQKLGEESKVVHFILHCGPEKFEPVAYPKGATHLECLFVAFKRNLLI